MEITSSQDTKSQEKIIKIRSKYDYIRTSTRQKLFQLIYTDGLTIKEAAVVLQIKYGTAKTIMRVFKTTGRIDRIVKSGHLFRFDMDDSGLIKKEINECFFGHKAYTQCFYL